MHLSALVLSDIAWTKRRGNGKDGAKSTKRESRLLQEIYATPFRDRKFRFGRWILVTSSQANTKVVFYTSLGKREQNLDPKQARLLLFKHLEFYLQNSCNKFCKQKFLTEIWSTQNLNFFASGFQWRENFENGTIL